MLPANGGTAGPLAACGGIGMYRADGGICGRLRRELADTLTVAAPRCPAIAPNPSESEAATSSCTTKPTPSDLMLAAEKPGFVFKIPVIEPSV